MMKIKFSKKGIIKFSLVGLFLFSLVWLISFILFSSVSDTYVFAQSGVEFINYDANEKTLIAGDITVKSPYDIVCRWSNASSLWKDCEVVIEVNNRNTKSDLILKGDGLLAKFLKDVRDLRVYTTYTYTIYNESILNRTCFNNLTPEQKHTALENKTLCYYNYTRKAFHNFQLATKLDKIHKNSVIGIKLEFKSPIEVDAGVYLKNQFNFTLLSDYNITLDPDISECSVLDQPGATYYLTANIINSVTSECINISANNIVLDCQGYMIDGIDGEITTGILIYRPPYGTNTNITIRNCMVQDWWDGIYLHYANNNTIINSIANSNRGDYYRGGGIFFTYSSHNKVINLTSTNNRYSVHYRWYCSNNQIINSTFFNNSEHNVRIAALGGVNQVINSIFNNNGDGVHIHGSGGNQVINSIFNNNVCGVYVLAASDNQVINSTFNGNGCGVLVYWYTKNNQIINSTFKNNTYGIHFLLTPNYYSIIYNNIIINNTIGIVAPYLIGSTIYNNLFNNTENVVIGGDENYWNTTRQAGKRIYSPGTEIGGNYWSNPSGTGYSDTCEDDDNDGFCDEPYLINTANIDYLPLSDKYGFFVTFGIHQPPSPTNWTVGTFKFNSIINNANGVENISTVLFEHNFTGTFLNETVTAFTNINATARNYSITKTGLSAGIYTIRFYANDSFNRWDVTGTAIYIINISWNQTDNIKAGTEYPYNLNVLGIPVATEFVSIKPYNTSVVVGQPLFSYYNLSVINTNNNTGLITTFTNVFANFSRYINLSTWINISRMEKTYASLPYNVTEYFTVDVVNITAYEKSFSCFPTIYAAIKKWECIFRVVVIEDEVTKTLPVIKYIDYSRLPEWNNRDKVLTSWLVNGKTTNTTYEEIDEINKVKITVGTNFSTSSLGEGEHTFNIIYWMPIITGGGGGGFLSEIIANVSFDITPLSITKFVQPGEHKLIVTVMEGHTFLVKNTGPRPIFIEVILEGDYKDWITLTDKKLEIYTLPKYISIEPGQIVGINLYTNIPDDARVGSYTVTVILMDRDSKVYKSIPINLIVSPAGAIYLGLETLYDKMMFPLVLSGKVDNLTLNDGIYVPVLVEEFEMSVPIGWLLVILTYVIVFYILKYIVNLKKRDWGTVKSYVLHLISLGASIIVLMIL